MLVDVPLKQTHGGERIVTILWDDLTPEEKEKLGKKVSESSPISESQSKRPRVADSLKKCGEVEGGEQEWKRQKNGPLQDRGKMEFVLYKVVETEWVEAHYHLLRIRKMTMSRTIRNMTSSRSDTRHFARNTG